MYCSFCVCVAHEKKRDAYCAALSKEMSRYERQPIDCVYFGGGTPSQLTEGQLSLLIDALHRHFFISPDAEITIEVNPDDVTDQTATLYAWLGFSRVSLGVQTFHDGYLKFFGRAHDAKTARQAFAALRQAGHENINLDLITSFPGQSQDDLNKDLREVCRLAPEHVSVYSLSVERHSRFFVDKMRLRCESDQADFYHGVRDVLTKNGFGHYEVSNFARKGFASRHNMNYWQGGNYIGLGLGAHGHLDGVRSWNEDRMTAYLKAIDENRSPCVGAECLSIKEQMIETFVFGLRICEGVDLTSLEARFSSSFDDERLAMIEAMEKSGLLKRKGTRVRATLKGLLVLDELSARLI